MIGLPGLGFASGGLTACAPRILAFLPAVLAGVAPAEAIVAEAIVAEADPPAVSEAQAEPEAAELPVKAKKKKA